MTTAGEWKARPEGPDYDATRARLIDAAEAAIRDRGVAALRLDAVADAVDLHRSSVYRYFDSKEALITAVVVQASLGVGHRVMAELGERATPREFLVDGLVLALGDMGDSPVFTSLLAPAASEAMARIAGTALTEGLRPLIEPLFVAAADRGVLRSGVSPEDAIQWLQIVATGLLRLPGLPEPDDLRALLDRMLVPVLLDVRSG